MFVKNSSNRAVQNGVLVQQVINIACIMRRTRWYPVGYETTFIDFHKVLRWNSVHV